MNPPMNDFIKDDHCSYCGTEHTEKKLWPRMCFRCYNESYKNPVPVVCMIIPIWGKGHLIQKRGIDPKKGGWAFPSGYIDYGEEWFDAATRELKEEMGLETTADQFKLLDVRNDTEGHMMVTCTHPGFFETELLNDFVPNSEVLEYGYTHSDDPAPLCFPTQEKVFKKFFT